GKTVLVQIAVVSGCDDVRQILNPHKHWVINKTADGEKATLRLFAPEPFLLPSFYSGSAGLLNSKPRRMLPWPNCGKPEAKRSPESKLDAVSSGGNRMSEFRKLIIEA